ncbi:MAG: sodium:solute symporter [Bacteroidota bacterium]|jgi:Na+/proline symporter
MSPILIITFIALYFGLLLGIAYFTSRNSNAASYFTGNKVSPWYIVAFGMIGDSLSGVTYISVPGKVINDQFSYLQLVLGYFAGYLVIAKVLLPVYYRMNLVSIYSYLQERFGKITQKTGSIFFILSRLLGAAGRLYLAAGVIQKFVFDSIEGLHIPFSVSVSIIILLMLLYTFKGGIKTLVWTDSLQSLFLVLGVIFSIIAIADALDLSLLGTFNLVGNSEYSKVFFGDPMLSTFFPKQFFGGMFIAIAMTGLDQNMMQKNLSCKSLGEAQKNILWFSVVMVLVNVFFISLGALLYSYYQKTGINLPMKGVAGKMIPATDQVFPNLALNNYLGIFAGLSFILGLTAATFSSADSVLTTLTTSAYIDLFEIDRNKTLSEPQKKNIRTLIHVLFAAVLLICILMFAAWNNSAIIDTILMVAGYTYGPLLGLFSLGLFTKISIKDRWVPLVCFLAPAITYFINNWLASNTKFKIGPELIIYNGLISFILLYFFLRKKENFD